MHWPIRASLAGISLERAGEWNFTPLSMQDFKLKNISCGYSKEPSQLAPKTYVKTDE